MGAIELTLFMLCVGGTVCFTVVAWKSIQGVDQSKKPRKLDTSLASKLPNVGKAGTAKFKHRRLIKKQGINSLKLSKLSAEQAAILLNCSYYVDAVWQQIPAENGSTLSAKDREDALCIILDHDTYLERVMTWRQARDANADFQVPADACQVAVAHLLADRARHMPHSN